MTDSILARARLGRIRNIMSILKEDIDNIKHIILLCKRNGHYCLSCSRKRKPGACGPTCALLRPDAYKVPGTMVTVLESLYANSNYINALIEQVCQYKVIAYDLQRRGDHITLQELAQWEKITHEWLHRGFNCSYRESEVPYDITYQFGEVDWTGNKSRDSVVLADDEYMYPSAPTDLVSPMAYR